MERKTKKKRNHMVLLCIIFSMIMLTITKTILSISMTRRAILCSMSIIIINAAASWTIAVCRARSGGEG